MSLSTDMLVAFVRVAEHLSVSAAAAELDVGKSVISKRVAQLEQAVRATLFSRSTRRIALTPAGEVYLDFARKALAAVDAADERLRTLRDELTGRIRLTAPFSWGERVLARLLPDFLAAHPGIEVELLLEDRVMDLAYEQIDIALRMTAAATPDLVTVPVAPLDWALCAAPAYLAGTTPPREPADLARHPCMSYWRERSDASWQLVRDGRRTTVRVRGRLRANTAEAVVAAARAGLGIALLPLYACGDDLAAGRLQRLLPEWTPQTRFGQRIVAVAAPDRIRYSRNQALLRFLQQRLQGPDAV